MNWWRVFAFGTLMFVLPLCLTGALAYAWGAYSVTHSSNWQESARYYRWLDVVSAAVVFFVLSLALLRPLRELRVAYAVAALVIVELLDFAVSFALFDSFNDSFSGWQSSQRLAIMLLAIVAVRKFARDKTGRAGSGPD